MHFIILGPPGSGKGTQSAKIIKELSLKHLSTGDMLRSEISKGTQLGINAKKIMDKGNLVSDEIVLDMVAEQVKSTDKGILFDGFPRTIEQAKGLNKLLKSLNSEITKVILLDVDNEEITNRMLSRGREDDNEKTIRSRLEVFDKQTAPLIDYYKKQNKLSNVLATGSIEEIFTRIKNILIKT